MKILFSLSFIIDYTLLLLLSSFRIIYNHKFIWVLSIILLIFLILYQTLNIKKHKIKKEYYLITIVISFLLFIFPLVTNITNTIKKYKSIQEGKNIINTYLHNNFESYPFKIISYKYNDGCHIICTDKPTWEYNIKTSLFDKPYQIILDKDNKTIVDNNFQDYYIKYNDLDSKYNEYLISSIPPLPNNIKLIGFVKGIKYTPFTEDNIIYDSTYIFDYFDIELDEYNITTVKQIAKDLYKTYNDYLSKYYRYSYMNLVIKIKQKNYMNCQIEQIDNKLRITFNPYINETTNNRDSFIDYIELN